MTNVQKYIKNILFCNQSGKCQKFRVNEEKCAQFHLMGSQAIFPVFFIHWLQKVSWNLDHRWLEYEICRFEVERIKNEDKNSIKINISGTFSCIFLQPTLGGGKSEWICYKWIRPALVFVFISPLTVVRWLSSVHGEI